MVTRPPTLQTAAQPPNMASATERTGMGARLAPAGVRVGIRMIIIRNVCRAPQSVGRRAHVHSLVLGGIGMRDCASSGSETTEVVLSVKL